MMLRRCAAALAALAIAAALVPAAADTQACSDADEAALYDTDPAFGLEGLYALPSEAPRALVVFAHGYTHRSSSWSEHILETAGHGAIAVAVDYRGTGPAPDNRGWPVRNGSEDLIIAAEHFVVQCGLEDVPVVLYGVSMGGNVSGYALAKAPVQPDGSPMFDHWIVVEGAVASIETYLGASALVPTGNATAANAVEDFEAECGGTFVQEPSCYLEMHLVARTPDLIASGVQDVILVHGLADGLVPYNQSRELATALRAAGMTTEFRTVLRRNDWQNPDTAGHEGGTTLDGYLAPATGQAGADLRPLAGHGTESSTTHIVIRTGLDRLYALLDGEAATDAEYLVDSELGTVGA